MSHKLPLVILEIAPRPAIIYLEVYLLNFTFNYIDYLRNNNNNNTVDYVLQCGRDIKFCCTYLSIYTALAWFAMWHCNFRFCRMKSDEVEFSVNSVRWGLNRVSKPDSSFPRSRALSLSHSLTVDRNCIRRPDPP